MAIVNEVVTAFTYKGNTDPLKDYVGVATQSAKTTAKFAAATVAATAAMVTLVKITLSGADAQAQLAKTIGVNVEALQKLEFAASVSGSTADAMSSSLTNLSRKIGEASVKGSEDFQRLGLSVRGANGQVKTADALLLELGRTFKRQNLSLQEQASYAEALGVDVSLLQLLGKTNEEITKLTDKAASLGVVTEKQAEGVIRFNDSLTTLGFGFKALSRETALALAPAIEGVADAFTEFLIDNGPAIREGISNVVDVLGWIVRPIINTIEALNAGKGALAAFTAGLVVLHVQLRATAITMLAATWPFVATTAAIVGLVLVIDDLWTGIKGGKSVIFDIVKSVGDWITGMVKRFTDWVDSLKKMFLSLVPDSLMRLLKFVGLVDGAKVEVKSVAELDKQEVATNIPQTIPAAQGVATSSSVSNNAVSQDVRINVNSPDPLAAGNDIQRVLTRELTDAQNQIGRGGR